MIVVSTTSSWSPYGNSASSSTNCSAQRVCGTHTIPSLTISITAFRRAYLLFGLLIVPRCGVYSPTGTPIRRSSWYSAVPLDFFSTRQLSGCHSLYSSSTFTFSSGNSSRSRTELSRMMLFIAVSSFQNTPHVVIEVKSERLLSSAAASIACIIYSQGGGSSSSHCCHHSRLQIELESPVGFCWYCAFHWYAGIVERVRRSASRSKNSGHSAFSLSLLSLRIAGNSTTWYWSTPSSFDMSLMTLPIRSDLCHLVATITTRPLGIRRVRAPIRNHLYAVSSESKLPASMSCSE